MQAYIPAGSRALQALAFSCTGTHPLLYVCLMCACLIWQAHILSCMSALCVHALYGAIQAITFSCILSYM